MVFIHLGLLLLCVAGAQRGWATEIDTLQARLVAQYLPGDASSAQTFLDSQRSDGSWTDIDYTNKDRTRWVPNTHLNRLKTMAQGYSQTAHPLFHSAPLLVGIQSGLRFWYAGKFTSANWWWNEIGQQLVLGPMLLILQGRLAQGLVDTGTTYLKDPAMTGANKVWLAAETVQRGVLRKSDADIRLGINAIHGEIFVSNGEGIQSDFSFHQHGPQLYMSGYGMVYLTTVTGWMHLVYGLSYAFPIPKIELMSKYVLEGTQWCIRRGNFDPSVQGREISRPGSGIATGLSTNLDFLAESDPAHALGYQNFKNHLRTSHDSSVVGNKHFWRSDYMAHRRPGFMTATHLCSKRTIGAELVNSENQKAFYFPFGFSPLLRHGNEYFDLYPVWDWARIPGVTSPHKTPPPMPGSQRGTTDFVGGASDSLRGVMTLELNIDSVSGYKSWFYFDREVVALGAGIKGLGNDSIFTSLNQTTSKGSVYAAIAAGTGNLLPQGSQILASPKWVLHDSVGYVFPESLAVSFKHEVQTGSWKSINPAYSDSLVSKQVFSLWLNHGVKPSSARYSYAIVPGISAAELESYISVLPFTVVSNTPVLQSVRHEALRATGAVFIAAGQVDLGLGYVLKVDKPCVVWSQFKSATLEVSLANPNAKALTVNAELLQINISKGKHAFVLPGDTANAGRSMRHAFAITGIPIHPVIQQDLGKHKVMFRKRGAVKIRAETVKNRILSVDGREQR